MRKDKILLKDIISNCKEMQAPTRTQRDSNHVEFIVGIGRDNYASIIMSKDALEELKK